MRSQLKKGQVVKADAAPRGDSSYGKEFGFSFISGTRHTHRNWLYIGYCLASAVNIRVIGLYKVVFVSLYI